MLRKGYTNDRRPVTTRAFTLIELLIVVAIILILASITLECINKVEAMAKETLCRNNQRQLAMGKLSFATNHNTRLPGSWYDRDKADQEAWKACWLAGSNGTFSSAPKSGTIYEYVGAESTYRCPILEVRPVGSGSGSNGRFDYVAFLGFSGAKLAKLPTYSKPGWSSEEVYTPVTTEEAPYYNLNKGHHEGAHSNVDRMAYRHRGYVLYSTIDGSVHRLERPQHRPLEDIASRWTAKAPSGATVSIGGAGELPNFGWWNSQ